MSGDALSRFDHAVLSLALTKVKPLWIIATDALAGLLLR